MYKVGDTITLLGIEYKIVGLSDMYWLSSENTFNEAIFDALNIKDKYTYISEIVEHRGVHGIYDFPPVTSIKDLNIVIEQLKIDCLIKETTDEIKLKENMFKENDYIVILRPKENNSRYIKHGWCYKQREDSKHVYVKVDCTGGPTKISDLTFYEKLWRYATPEEIAVYDIRGEPFDTKELLNDYPDKIEATPAVDKWDVSTYRKWHIQGSPCNEEYAKFEIGKWYKWLQRDHDTVHIGKVVFIGSDYLTCSPWLINSSEYKESGNFKLIKISNIEELSESDEQIQSLLPSDSIYLTPNKNKNVVSFIEQAHIDGKVIEYLEGVDVQYFNTNQSLCSEGRFGSDILDDKDCKGFSCDNCLLSRINRDKLLAKIDEQNHLPTDDQNFLSVSYNEPRLDLTVSSTYPYPIDDIKKEESVINKTLNIYKQLLK